MKRLYYGQGLLSPTDCSTVLEASVIGHSCPSAIIGTKQILGPYLCIWFQHHAETVHYDYKTKNYIIVVLKATILFTGRGRKRS